MQPKHCCDISITTTYPSGRPIHWCDLSIGETYSQLGPTGLGPIHWHDLSTGVIPECMRCNHLLARMSTNCFIDIKIQNTKKKYKEGSYRNTTDCQQRGNTTVNATVKMNVSRNITTIKVAVVKNKSGTSILQIFIPRLALELLKNG